MCDHHRSVRYQRYILFVVFLWITFFLHLGVACATPTETFASASITEPTGHQARIASGQILVKFRAGMTPASIGKAHSQIGGLTVRAFPRIGWQVVKLPPGLAVRDALARYRRLADVESAEPDYVIQATDANPNDPMFGDLWGLAKIQAPSAWETATGSGTTVIAVLDTGVQTDHPDLASNVWRNPNEVSGNGVDDDGNGHIDDVFGIDAVNDDANPSDDNGHGTHVAGTIGAVGNNGIGVTGVIWSTKILPVKVLDSQREGLVSWAIQGYSYVTYLKTHGIPVRAINNSWSFGSDSVALKDAIEGAGAAGIVSICAAGNGAHDGIGDDNDAPAPYTVDNEPQYPARFPSDCIISVAASNEQDQRPSFSNYGNASVDLCAPGTGVWSTWLGGGYQQDTGTSMAAPHVSGAIGLLCGLVPELTVQELKDRILDTVDQVPAWSGLSVTGGRLNLGRAVGTLPVATHLVFTTQPVGGPAFRPLPTQPVVAVTDALGAILTTYTGPVTLRLEPGTGGDDATLGGTTTVSCVAGVAHFTDLSVDRAGTGYVLKATGEMPRPSYSDPFDTTQAAVRLAYTTEL